MSDTVQASLQLVETGIVVPDARRLPPRKGPHGGIFKLVDQLDGADLKRWTVRQQLAAFERLQGRTPPDTRTT
jgi:hypothetical protein